ncbi:NUDIX hydrolase [bacterium]|nr:MAG: NUDIX hydrolase [bacterium]
MNEIKTEKNLRETGLTSEQIVDGHLMKAWRDEVRLPNGKTAVREYIRHPGAAIMIPLFANGDTILVKQFRYPVGKVFIELPAGKLDGKEPMEEAAQRELAEEAGFTSDKLTLIAEFYPCIGYSNEKMWLYLAEGLKEADAITDHDEFLELMRVPFIEAVAMVRRGEIDDMKTIAAILLADSFLQQRKKGGGDGKVLS